MSIETVPHTGKRTLAGLIGWLSVCILAAGWGPRLDANIRDVWMRMGVLGLVAAVGLEIADRTHSRVKKNARRKTTQRRIAQNLDNASAERESFSRLADSVRRVCQDGDARATGSLETDGDARLQFHHPAQLRPLMSEGVTRQGLRNNAMRAYVRNLSAGGVGLLHKERIDSPRFLLEFSLNGGERLTFVVELIWQHRLADGPYHSGGRLVNVLNKEGQNGDANQIAGPSSFSIPESNV